MTIKDIESASGIPRANIRFYEAQGFISPNRAENGYRDYSEAELETLLRIKLLRSLEISIEEIKALISGDAELSPLLAKHMAALAEKRETVTRLHELCGMMQADSVSFDSLDARRYLSIYEQRQTSIASALQADTLPKVPHPFRRYAARGVDGGIYTLLIYAVLVLLDVEVLELSNGADLLISLAGIALTFGLEPVMLHYFGTTPGKWIFGMYVTDMCGEKPSIYTGFYRYWDILRYGYGFLIPFYNIYRMWKSMEACLNGEDLPWEKDTILIMRDARNWRIAAWAGSEVLYIALLVLLLLASTMPRHIGKLSIEEFANNYNDYAEDYNLDYYLVTDKDEHIPYYKSATDLSSLSSFLSFTTDGDIITEVRLSKYNHSRTDTYQREITLAALSFVRAQPGARLSPAPLGEMLTFMEEHPYEDFAYTVCGVKIVCDYEYEGYVLDSTGELVATTADYDERYSSVNFTMSLE